MNYFLFIFALFLSLATYSQNHDGHTGTHTPNMCTNDSKICAHLMFPQIPNSADESKFILHFVTNTPITDVQVNLWMPEMGHGSAPVIIKSLDQNHYQISQAYFIMPGQWAVQVHFLSDNQTQKLEFPILIQN